MKLEPSTWKPDPRVQRLCEWARDNEPLLTFHSREEIEKIVRTAWSEKAGLLAAISVPSVFVTVYVTWFVAKDFFGPSPTEWQSVAASLLAGAAMTVIVRFIGDLILHREITRLARGTYGQLSHE